MLRPLDRFLDHTTMYRVVLYYLAVLVGVALTLGVFRAGPQDPLALGFSTTVILLTCVAVNWLFARAFNVPANGESVYITGLILVLILDPVAPSDAHGAGALAMVAVWAMASKFLLAYGRRHLFNPAAVAVFLSGLLIDTPPTWWVGGSRALLPMVLMGGALVVRKLRRLDLVAAFILVEVATVLATTAPSDWGAALNESLLSSPLFFFAFVMLTEPLTSPGGRWMRCVFAALVGFLSAPNVHIGVLYFTPEEALLVGNLFAFAVGPRRKLMLTLERIEQASANAYDFIFKPERRLTFRAGQYGEWTLGLRLPDNRGNRRYFTVASAPGADEIRLGVKFYPTPSAFKRRLAALVPGDAIYLSPMVGDFTLPADHDAKLAFLAGGIGITPFRSMLRYLLEQHEARPIVVLYGSERVEDIAYRDVLDAAHYRLGIATTYAVAEEAPRGYYPGFIDERLIRYAIPDYKERMFYVSGPQTMVTNIRRTLLGIGIHRSRIKVDFFPGLT